jgi:RNA polymerase sigma factor (sigma-70 family)
MREYTASASDPTMRDDPTVVSLVARVQSGDQRAWDEIVERYAPLVWSICRRYGLDRTDVDDVGQTVWLRLLTHLPELRQPAALPGWLATTTRRECLRVLQTARRRETAELPADPVAVRDDDEIDGVLLAAELNAALRAGFAQLPEMCRHLLGMLLLRDPPLPYAEVGARLGIAMGGIGPTRSRCLAKLRGSPAMTAFINIGSGRHV